MALAKVWKNNCRAAGAQARHAFFLLFAASSLFQVLALPALCGQTEMGFEGDVLVQGTDGTATDPNLKVKGFAVFGSTQTAYSGINAAPGNVVVNGTLSVSSGAYFVDSSTFPAASKIFINDGSAGQLLGKNTDGALQWTNAGALGDNLGNHTATTALNLAQFPLVNVSSIAMRGDGIRIATSIYAGASGVFISTSGQILTVGLGNGTALPNPRGGGAVDLQNYRTASSKVAAGLISVVAGGGDNAATAEGAVVSGGNSNTASGSYSIVSGGYGNIASNWESTVSGGSANTASQIYSIAAGGYKNTASGSYSAVSGGNGNTASGANSTVSGGLSNMAGGLSSTVSGGESNTANASNSTVSGGLSNTASNYGAVVSGGESNTANGQYSWAGGAYSSSTVDGAFTWSDSQYVENDNRVADRTVFKNRGGFLVTGSTNPVMTGMLDRGMLVTGNGFVGISTGMPYAALDLVSSGTTANVYAQIWRDSTGLVVASMTADGKLSTLQTLPGDNLGNHTATAQLKMGNYAIWSSSDITAARYQINGSTMVAILPGTNSIAYGVYAGTSNAGDYNVFIGNYSGASNRSGGYNTASGSKALRFNTFGNFNTAVGYQTLSLNSVGSNNTASGQEALYSNTSGNNNVAKGYRSLYSNTTGSDNTALGYFALGSNTTGAGNMVGGSNSLYNSQTGSANVVFGAGAGLGKPGNSFSSSTIMGYEAGNGLWTGSDNILLGWRAGDFLTTGARNIVIGYDQDASGAAASNELNIGGVLFGKLDDKTIGISTRMPQGALDIVSTGTASNIYAQIWRDGSGVIVASMTSQGALYATLPPGTGGDNLGNHTATKDLAMANFNVGNANFITASSASFTNGVTASSFTASGIGYLGAQLRFNPTSGNIVISSESAAALGAGVRVSTNMYIVGFASATKYYGDGSALTGLTGLSDNLGNHTATQDLKMAGFQITNAGPITASSVTAIGIGFYGPQVALAPGNIQISSETSAALGAGVRVSTNMYIVGFASATKYYGDGSALTGLTGLSDNLGNHTATQDLKMAGFQITNAGPITASSVTATGIGFYGAQVALAPGNIQVSSETNAALGAGVRVSTNMYIVGFASATKYYGDGSGLTGISGDNLGNHTATQNLNMGANQLYGSGPATLSSFTASGIGFLGAQLRFNPASGNIVISSESATTLGAGVRVSTNMYIVGFTSATNVYANNYYGNGSNLYGISGDNLGNHTATQNLNLGANQLYGSGPATLSSFTATGIGYLGAQLRFNPASGNIVISSESAAALGAGVRVSTNMYIVGFASATNVYANNYYGNGSNLYGISGDNLGNHTATKDLAMGNFNVGNANFITASSGSFVNGVTASSLTASGTGFLGPQLRFNASSPNLVISSETSAALGAGVRVSTNIYIVGFSSATKYYGDGSALTGLTGLSDNLGNHTATQDLKMAGFQITNAGPITASSVTVTGIGFYGAQVALAPGSIQISSEASSTLGAGVRVSTNMYIVGFASATNVYANNYYGNGSNLYGISGDNLGNHTATQNLNLGANQVYGSGPATLSSFTATGIGYLGAQLRFNPGSGNIVISSESATALGAGVRVSTNMYIVGFTSATKYYGDGSALTGLTGLSDNLGNHTATQDLKMAGFQITNAGSITASSVTATGIGFYGAQVALAPGNIQISSETSTALGAGVRVSTNMYIVGFASATKYYGDGSGLTGISGDNLGNHTATQNLNLGANQFYGSGPATLSSFTASGIGFLGAQLRFNPTSGNIVISSESAAALGAGVRVSTNMYIVGFASATNVYANNYYGNGSNLYGISGDNLGNHTATKDLAMANFNVGNANFITASSASFTNGVTASSFTASGIGYLGAQLRFNPTSGNIVISSESAAALGAGVRVSTNMYIVGFASATKYYGDGSGLTGISGDNLGNHTATQNLNMGANQLYGSGPATLSSFTASGIGYLGAQLRFNPASGNIVISSESAAALGAGVRVSTNMYIVGFASATKYYGDGSSLTGLSALGDNLGNHTATTDLNMSGNDVLSVGSITIVGKGLQIATDVTSSGNGIFISTAGSIMTVGAGNGSTAPGARGIGAVDLQTSRSGAGQIASGQYSSISGGQSNSASGQYSAVSGGQSNVANALYSMVAGGAYNEAKGMSAWAGGYYSASRADGAFTWSDSEGVLDINQVVDRTVFKNRGGFLITGSTNPAMTGYVDRGFLVTGDGMVGISIEVPSAALDVVSSATASNVYAQIWRDSSGVEVASMTSEGVLYATLPPGAGGDNLGNHTATTQLKMGNYAIWSSSDITAARYQINGSTMVAVLPGIGSIAYGIYAGTSNITGGDYNVFIGNYAGTSNTTGINNTANGAYSLYSNTTGGDNTANGNGALYSNTTGITNTANGVSALYSNTGGGDNTANGAYALYSNTTGHGNTAHGSSALYFNTTGGNNTANGVSALYSNTTGGDNTANGSGSLNSNTTGMGNTANGVASLDSNTAGNENTATGVAALHFNTTGEDNTANGAYSLRYNQTGSANSAFGYGAGGFGAGSANSFSSSTVIGYQAGNNLTTGSDNTFLGWKSGYNVTTGTGNIVIGYNQLTPAEGTNNFLNIGGVLYGDLSARTIGISTRVPQGALDIVSTGTASNIYAQIWRNGSGVIVASMTSQGALYATLPPGTGGDNLGNHTATKDLAMANFNVGNANFITASSASFTNGITASSLTASGTGFLGPQLRFNAGSPNLTISSETAVALGAGVRVSTNVYIVGFSSAAKYYGDGSSLTGTGDNLGSHTATKAMDMAGFQIKNVSSMTIIAPDTIPSSLWVSTSAARPHLFVSTNGNVGIGNTSPAALLQLSKPGSMSVSDMIFETGGASGILYNTSKIYSKWDGAAAWDQGRLTLAGTVSGPTLVDVLNVVGGKVGVMTTVPALALETNGSAALPAASGASQNGGSLRLSNTSATNSILDFGGNPNSPYGYWVQAANKTDYSVNYPLALNPNGGNVGIGTATPQGLLHLAKSGASSVADILFETGGQSGAMYKTGQIYAKWDGSAWNQSRLTIAGTVSGSALVDVLNVVGGTVGISTRVPQAALDVVSTGTAQTQFAQIWRGGDGVIVASMSATGDFMAARFVGISGSGDNLGDHNATTRLNMGNYAIWSSSDITAARYQINGSTMVAVLPGNGSIAYGIYAGTSNITGGDYNVFIGNYAGTSNTTGNGNTATGNKALYSNAGGTTNSSFGYYSLYSNKSGNSNTAIGVSALYSNTSGNSNTASGFNALFSNTIGIQNVAAGDRALYSNTSGQNNVANGAYALYSNTSGSDNISSGKNSLLWNQRGSGNTVFGGNAGGFGAGAANSFSSATIMGYQAGYGLTTGSDNIFLGWQAGYSVTSGTGNIVIGYNIGPSGATANNEINIGGVYKGNISSGTATIGKYTVQAADSGITLTVADFGKTITVNSASAQTVTLPSVTAADIGATITIVKLGSGKVTIQAAASTYIADSSSGGTLYNSAVTPAYASVTLVLVASDRWMLIGGYGAWITT